eukprot:COSAG06_NODE_2443_length_6870_cov_2.396544_3_plen_188_part_00
MAPLYTKSDHFTKTGSGQTYRKVEKRDDVCVFCTQSQPFLIDRGGIYSWSVYVWAECLPPPPGSQQPPCSDLVEYDFQLSIDQVRNDTGSVKQEGLVSNLLAVKNDARTQTGSGPPQPNSKRRSVCFFPERHKGRNATPRLPPRIRAANGPSLAWEMASNDGHSAWKRNGKRNRLHLGCEIGHASPL